MAGVMPKIGDDPFRVADTYNRQMTQLGAQGEQNAQNTLLNMFRAEARRQEPWSDLPVDLAKQENAGRINLSNAEALAGYKQSIKPGLAPAKIGNMIRASAKAYGIDPDIMMTTAQLESNFNPGAVSKTGAKGVFQVTGGYAADNGIADPFDPQQNIDGTMRGTVNTIRELQAAGIKPDAGTIYLAHQQGTAGAKALILGAQKGLTAEQALLPAYGGDARKARQAVIVNGGRPGMSAAMFANMWMDKANKLYKARVAMRKKSAPVFTYGGKEYDLDSMAAADDDTSADDTSSEDDNAS